MARADLLTNLVRFGTTGDRARFGQVLLLSRWERSGEGGGLLSALAEERAEQNENATTGGEA